MALMPLRERDSEEWFENVCQRIRAVVSLPTAALERSTALAFHEAGHAVVDQENGLHVARVCIGEFGGRPEGRAHTSAHGAVVEAMLNGGNPGAVRPIIEGAVAGILAEARVTAVPLWTDAYADLTLAKQVSDDAWPTEAEADVFLDRCIEGAHRILIDRWSAVRAIAEVLAVQGEITGAHLEELLTGPR